MKLTEKIGKKQLLEAIILLLLLLLICVLSYKYNSKTISSEDDIVPEETIAEEVNTLPALADDEKEISWGEIEEYDSKNYLPLIAHKFTADITDIPQNVLLCAYQEATRFLSRSRNWHSDYEYTDFRIESIEWVYTYNLENGDVFDVYQFNYEFASNDPDNILLAGGMYMTEDKWICPGYPNSHFVIKNKENGEARYFGINDDYPGGVLFTKEMMEILYPPVGDGFDMRQAVASTTEYDQATIKKLLSNNTAKYKDWYTLCHQYIKDTNTGEIDEKIASQYYLIGEPGSFKVYGKGDTSALIILSPDNHYIYTEYCPYTSNYMVEPEYLVSDFDSDGTEELAIILYFAHGTGLSIESLFMADQTDDGDWILYHYSYTEYINALLEHLTTRREGDSYYLLVDGNLAEDSFTVASDEKLFDDEKYYFSVESFINFEFNEDNQIEMIAQVEKRRSSWPQALDINNYLVTKVSYKGNDSWELGKLICLPDDPLAVNDTPKEYLVNESFYADVNQDSIKEKIRVKQEVLKEYQGVKTPGFGSISVYLASDDYNPVWTWDVHHTESTFIYVTHIDGKDYLAQYFPTINQGIYAYSYKIFSLDADGNEVIYASNEAENWINTTTSEDELQRKIDAFKKEFDAYLQDSFPLLEFEYSQATN